MSMPDQSLFDGIEVQSEDNIRLYYSPGACSLAPHILLEELNISYQLELISVAEEKTASPAFLIINPKSPSEKFVNADKAF